MYPAFTEQPMPPTKIFLSCVSTEFRSYRLKLANHLGALKGQPYQIRANAYA